MTRQSKHPNTDKMAAIVKLSEVRAQRTMAATQARLVPDATIPLEAEELSRRVAAQLATLPENDRKLLRREVLLAVHDLEGLITALQSQMNELALELRKVSTHTSAASAYGRTAHRPGDRR